MTEIMDIDKQLESVANYFKDKILTGDYTFVKCDQHTAEILIDKKYSFYIWIANDPKEHLSFYDRIGVFASTMDKYLHFTTQKERKVAWKHLKPHVEDYGKNILRKEKEQRIKELQKELNSLK